MMTFWRFWKRYIGVVLSDKDMVVLFEVDILYLVWVYNRIFTSSLRRYMWYRFNCVYKMMDVFYFGINDFMVIGNKL